MWMMFVMPDTGFLSETYPAPREQASLNEGI